AGDLARARQLVQQARACKPVLDWREDTPDKLEADIARAEAKGKPAAAAKPTPPPTAGTREEAVAPLRAARELLAQGKLDEAAGLANHTKGMTAGRWGLFEDNPDKVLQDVARARVKKDMEDSVQVLAEARKLYEKGDYDAASREAYRA